MTCRGRSRNEEKLLNTFVTEDMLNARFEIPMEPKIHYLIRTFESSKDNIIKCIIGKKTIKLSRLVFSL